MSLSYRRVAGQFFNRPLAIAPAHADVISNFLLARMADGPQVGRGAEADGTVAVHAPAASRFHGETPLSEDGTRRPLPFRRTEDGVAILTLVGEWVNRGGWVGASSGVISYEGFAHSLEAAVRDPRTKAILLDMESPGGEAVGAFEAAAAVRAATAVKPVWALTNGLAASAMYAIASGASRIVSIPTGISGSIGVVLAHFDMSEFLRKEGIKPTFIHAGARKIDANPYEALPEAVRDRLQGEVDAFYGLFVQTVAAGRPSLTEKAIRDTEAGTFMGADAKRLGLVDDLGSLEGVLAELNAGEPAALQARGGSSHGATLSSPTPAASAALAPENTDVTDTEASQIRAQERARLKGILGSPEAKGRESQAMELALNTDLSAETCASILRAAPSGDTAAFFAEREGRKELALEPEHGAAGTGASPRMSAESSALWGGVADKLNAGLPKAPGR